MKLFVLPIIVALALSASCGAFAQSRAYATNDGA